MSDMRFSLELNISVSNRRISLVEADSFSFARLPTT